MRLEDPATNPPSEVYRAFHDYFEVIPADTSALLDEVFALRYQVYCVEHPFENPHEHLDGRERDEYDTRAAHALIRHKRTGYCAAAVRLILPDYQHPETAFPLERACTNSLYEEAKPWIGNLDRLKSAEISRLAVSKAFRRRLGEAETISGVSAQAVYSDAQGPDSRRRGFPHITLGLFAAIVRMSVEQGIIHWFAVMEPTLLRLLQRFGIHFPPIGPLVEHHGLRQPTLAAAATVVDGILRKRPDIWEIVTDRGRFVPRATT
ncbi:MAG: PEP-CTERM/exosortase system-associated acyltransferase [Nitrococcus mobilis]|nr:PEP-CTERM/exosortase system-associated acyltransferase [Nitrococcus mobilis]